MKLVRRSNMKVAIVHNPKEVYNLLKNRDRFNYIYQFNNLELKEWKNVICYGLYDDTELKEVAMLCVNYHIPVLLAASFENEEYNIELISKIKTFLPAKFYVHIDKSTLEAVFSKDSINDVEEYMNMGLRHNKIKMEDYKKDVVRVDFEHIEDIKQLLSEGNPEAWLDEELVKLERNFGIFIDDKLVSFAGIHAYSEEYKVVALAHITTHPSYRKKGYCERVFAALITDLNDKIEFMGLNVKVDNVPAVSCYKKMGFTESGKFIACEIEMKRM
jgi:RimJ/RimL family protein N-acetyltransferase